MHIHSVPLDNQQTFWLVIDDNGEPITPITEFLRFLSHTEKSPHTLRAYANHLKLYWEFLQFRQRDWQTVTTDDFAQFVY